MHETTIWVCVGATEDLPSPPILIYNDKQVEWKCPAKTKNYATSIVHAFKHMSSIKVIMLCYMVNF